MAGNTNSGRKGKSKAAKADEIKDFNAKCPSFLTGLAREHWKRTVPLLVARNIITDLDEFALVRMCQNYEWWREAQASIKDRGMIIDGTTDRGAALVRENPSVKHVKEFNAAFEKLETKFGLTPKDRESIKAHKGKVTKSIRDSY